MAYKNELSLYEKYFDEEVCSDEELCCDCGSNKLTYEKESNIIVCKRCGTIQ
jgi:hypothetical protein